MFQASTKPAPDADCISRILSANSSKYPAPNSVARAGISKNEPLLTSFKRSCRTGKNSVLDTVLTSICCILF